jgi:mannosyltransferase
MGTRQRTYVALAVLVAAGAALRFATLDLQSFWIDEGATVRLLRQDFDGMLDGIPVTEKTPPLYYLVAWLWTRPFGTGEVGVRSLSALVGTLTLPVVFAAGRRLVSERAGLIATALAAFNPLLVWYSQEARAYALLVLLAALALLFFARAMEGERRALAWWPGASALALATHYFALFVVLPLAVWLVHRGPDRRGAVRAVAGAGVAGAALLPLAIDQSGNTGSNFITGTGLVTRVFQVPKQLLLGFDAPAEAALTAAAIVVAAAGAWLALTRGSGRTRLTAGVLAAAVAIPLVLALAGADFLIARNLIAAWVPLAVVLGAGFAATRRVGPALAATLCALSITCIVAVFTRPEFQRDDWRGVAEALGEVSFQRGLVVNPVAGSVPLGLYMDDLEEFPIGYRHVQEVSVVAVANRRPGQTPRPPRPASPYLQDFYVAERREEDTFTLVRFGAPVPVPVPADVIGRLKLDEGQPVTLLQTPRR